MPDTRGAQSPVWMLEMAWTRTPRPDDSGDDRAELRDSGPDWRTRVRAAIVAVDDLLEVLEDGNLQGADTEGGPPPRWRERLEATGVPVPRIVSGATTAASLRERLVQWQSYLLNAAYPRRRRSTHGAHVTQDVVGEVVPWSTAKRRRRKYVSRRSVARAAWQTTDQLVHGSEDDASTPQGGEPEASRNLDGLTDREIAVLRVVAEGLTNAQVASRLHLSEHTVAAHLRSIFRKTEVASRSAATRYAFEKGLA
jgi:DNA-binding CsgD family transcriptional regulator